jgi:glycosyltransferase involved in cell wall biosynthesis
MMSAGAATRIRTLLIGPLPPPMGGDTRHFATLVEDLGAHERFAVTVVDTSRGERHSDPLRNLAAAMRTIFAVASRLGRVDVVSYHASDRGMVLLGPVIVGLCRLARTPVVLRIFGGSFDARYERSGTLSKWIIRRAILSADVILLQTQRLIRMLRERATGELVWFSTYIRSSARPESVASAAAPGRACTRFVFLGHLWRTKGIETILDSAARLPGDCTIDLYGPLDEYTEEQIRSRGAGRVRYGGFLSHAQVDAKLWEYDCLVLPTFHPGEGYPGVIAEAFAHAIPVITTRWLAIPEIVSDECGVLIEPGDTDAFVRAVTELHRDPQRWRRMQQGATVQARQFDHLVWSRKFEQICEQLVQD